MNRVPVQSSAVVSLGYADGILEVEYPGQRVYRMEVTPEQYDGLMAAESIGRALNALKAECVCTKVEGTDGE